MATVSVVIPFFQRKPGLLTQALDSICRQDFQGDIVVLVVDDQSPTDPAGEVPANLPTNVRAEILRQENAGPGAARNRGLAQVAADSDYVAFLDSDDQWLPGHLRNAVDALGDSADIYFANHLEPDSSIDAFSERGLVQLARHRAIGRGANCFEYVGDMRDQIIRANIIETSTVVFRWSSLRSARFDPTYRNAFEDHLFWIDLVGKARAIVFSSDVEVQYGRGVSIWRSGGLGKENSFPKIIDQLRFINSLLASHGMSADQIETLKNIRSGVRDSFVAEMLHRLKRASGINWAQVSRILRLDPPLLFYCLPISLRIATRRMQSAE